MVNFIYTVTPCNKAGTQKSGTVVTWCNKAVIKKTASCYMM